MGVKDGRGSKVPYEIHGFKGVKESITKEGPTGDQELATLVTVHTSPHPLFWSLKSDSIVMFDILPYDLRLNTRITTHKPPISAL